MVPAVSLSMRREAISSAERSSSPRIIPSVRLVTGGRSARCSSSLHENGAAHQLTML